MTRNILLATLFTLASAVVLLVIFLTEKAVRIPEALAATEATQLERGAMDYEQYCSACHGLAGQGRANETGAPALNDLARRYMTPDANGTAPFDARFGIKEKYGTLRNYVEATISVGVRGTPMPAWSQTVGGPLRPDQIENLAIFILAWNGQPPESAVALAGTVAAANRPTADPRASPFGAGQAMFQAKGCTGCHALNDQKIVGPGLGGLFQPEGTAAYGTNLPNGKPVNEENVKEWIDKGTAGFTTRIDPLDGEQYVPPGMPAMPITDEDYAVMLNFLKNLKRDGTPVEGADQPSAPADAGTLQPTVAPTTQPGNSPGAAATTPPTAPGGEEVDTTATAP